MILSASIDQGFHRNAAGSLIVITLWRRWVGHTHVESENPASDATAGLGQVLHQHTLTVELIEAPLGWQEAHL